LQAEERLLVLNLAGKAQETYRRSSHSGNGDVILNLAHEFHEKKMPGNV
jgi:hypothetical protein